MPGFWQGLADWLGWEPVPGTPEHREALFRAVKAKNDELAKPPEQRDEARLVELKKRVLRLRIEAIQVRGSAAPGCGGRRRLRPLPTASAAS